MTMIMDYVNTATILFFTLQFINVVLSTMKTVLTVKANKHVAMLINTITYTFYSGVVKLMTGQDMVVVLAVTFLTNVIGVYIAMFILEKAKKDAEAVKAYTAAANNAAYQESTRAEAAYCLGCFYVAKKDNAKARDAFKRAIVSNPTSQTTVYWSQLAGRAMDRLPAGK